MILTLHLYHRQTNATGREDTEAGGERETAKKKQNKKRERGDRERKGVGGQK